MLARSRSVAEALLAHEELDAGTLDRHRAGQDPLDLGVALGDRLGVGARTEIVAVERQLGLLGLELVVADRDLVEQPDQVVLAQQGELVAAGLADLDHDREAEQRAQQRDEQVRASAPALVARPAARCGAGRRRRARRGR